jgi:hypothetical protein
MAPFSICPTTLVYSQAQSRLGGSVPSDLECHLPTWQEDCSKFSFTNTLARCICILEKPGGPESLHI